MFKGVPKEWRDLASWDHAKIQDDFYKSLPYSRRVKREAIKNGYTHQMSIYGILKFKDERDPEFRRIEILSDIEPDQRLVSKLYHWFYEFPPLKTYTIWIYDSKEEGIKLVGDFV